MRIMMHAPTNLLEVHSHYEAVRHNLINSNFGELLFPYSLSRALMLDSVEIDYCNFLKRNIPIAPEEINEKYDCLLLPLANNFRASFAATFEGLVDYLRKITIPIVVPCIGWQGQIGEELEAGKLRDDINREFCKIVLEKSPCIGVRGEATGRYLESLGFKAEEDFMVLGCPSMYMFGESLPVPKPLNLTKDSRININNKLSLPYKIHKIMRTVAEEYPNSYFIPQNHYELKLLYSGVPLSYSFNKEITHPTFYPLDLTDELYVQDRVRAFVDVPSWFEFLKKGELNFGTRIHGNLAGVLSGNPTFIVACDGRVNELASYHNVPHVALGKLQDDARLEDIIESVDFNQVQNGHKERFERYLGFMHKSGFETVFDNGTPETTRFDQLVSELEFPGPIVTPAAAPKEELDERMAIWGPSMKAYIKRQKKNPTVGKISWERDKKAEEKLLKKSATTPKSKPKRSLNKLLGRS